MPISSLIIRTSGEDQSTLLEQIDGFLGVEVCEVQGENIIVLTETESKKADQHMWMVLEGLPGVHGLDLIYNNFEDLEIIEEPIEDKEVLT